jgi:hypothetical protein
MDDDPMTDYSQEWARYQLRKTRIMICVFAEFLAFLPFVWIVGVISRKLFPTMRPAFGAGLLWILLYAFTGIQLRIFPCPRCGKNFFAVLGWHNFDRTCVHCGLPKPRRISLADESK